jgi:hypothetical protein
LFPAIALRTRRHLPLYRFPLYPTLDLTITYMGIINPALDPTNDYASAFSLRFVTVF